MTKYSLAAMAAVLALLGLAQPALGMSPVLEELEAAFVRLGEEVRPVVVNIDTRGATPDPEMPGGAPGQPNSEDMDQFFRFFGIPFDGPAPERRMPQERATGSGFIYDSEGHIVTNNHVVEGADRITVRLWNGDELDAEIVGRDPDTDLAVLKVTSEMKLPVAELGDSDTLKVGQFAIAMGSPRGFEGSLSFGHISALGRDNLAGLAVQGLRFQNLIQTDAAINLGNSGGPLCNIDGQIVGVNLAIVWGANSIGFAIPVNTVKQIVPKLITDGRVSRGYLGVAIKDAGDYAESLGLPDDNGAFVERVQPGTPAERAKLEVYDVVRKVNGEVVEGASDLVRKISLIPPGEEATLEVWRDEKPMDVKVMLDEWQPEKQQAQVETSRQVLGLRVRAVTPEILERLGVEAGVEGVLVTDIVPGSPGEEAGLQRGDVILEVDREPIRTPENLRDIVSERGEPGKKLLFRYVRGDSPPSIVAVQVPQE